MENLLRIVYREGKKEMGIGRGLVFLNYYHELFNFMIREKRMERYVLYFINAEAQFVHFMRLSTKLQLLLIN